MVGFGSDASRLTQARAWVVESAAGRGVAVSARLVCETAVLRLGVSGVTLTVDNAQGRGEMRHSTGLLGTQLAELQVTVGEGPCADADRAGGPVLVGDLNSPDCQRRWPLFAPLAVEAGACALFALPLCVGAIRIGVLALHDVRPRQLESATLADALAFAALALRLLLDEQAGVRTGDGDPAADLPLHSLQVHQATGMIAGQLEVPMEEAFARLRARAFTDQRPLADLAGDVVARRLRFDAAGETT
jgi:hypothetical protein